jgi:chemotaxis protein MotB
VKPGEEDTKAHELVLIRRRSGGEEGGHHGGVWKIAYADFMTAMMAFFLVMWLINSTDQKVLTQVANYFNPMRLTDNAPQSKGLQTLESGDQGKPGKQNTSGDPKEKKHSKEKAKESPSEKSQDKDKDKAKEKARDKAAEKDKGASAAGEAKQEKEAAASGNARYSEQTLFGDPYGTLARIAAEAPSEVSATAAATAEKGGAPSAGTYRDPFDPSPQQDGNLSGLADAAAGAKAPVPPVAKADSGAQAADAARIAAEAKSLAEAAKVAQDAATFRSGPSPDAVNEQALQQAAKLLADQASAQAAEKLAAAEAEASKIAQDIKSVTSQLSGTLPNIDVTVTDDGVLISLTDGYDFGMFAIASAEPRPVMVVVMEKVAKILQANSNTLIVRGHTDGRRYRSGNYDNWRLSTARAHMAYYMLVRGGVDEKRFEKIEGHADRHLRIPEDPGAAQNRRIEILLRGTKR